MSNWTPDPLHVPEDEPAPVKVQSSRVLRNLILALIAIAIVVLALLLPPASRSGSDLPPQSRSVAPLAVVATSFQPLDLDAASAGTVPETVLPLSGTQQSDGGGVSSDSIRDGREGTIAQAKGHGPDYLAIPIGPGHLVDVCGPASCWRTISTDAGPNHDMLVAGRIADVALGHWLAICGLPESRGTCEGSWHVVDLPATDR